MIVASVRREVVPQRVLDAVQMRCLTISRLFQAASISWVDYCACLAADFLGVQAVRLIFNSWNL